jgi:hypothetical protein
MRGASAATPSLVTKAPASEVLVCGSVDAVREHGDRHARDASRERARLGVGGRVKQCRALEVAALAHPVRRLFPPRVMGDRPGVEHPARENHVRDQPPPRVTRRRPPRPVPEPVRVHEIAMPDLNSSAGARPAAPKSRRGNARGKYRTAMPACRSPSEVEAGKLAGRWRSW